MRLTREVRFSLVDDAVGGPITNSWGGWPAAAGLTPYLLLRVTVEGEVDRVTGYLCNIALIDRAVRELAIPLVRQGHSGASSAPPVERLVATLHGSVAQALPASVRLHRLELRPTPYLAYGVSNGASFMVTMTQSFEFSAAHRLYCASLSEEENRRTFGKCTNPNGHGHNYVVEVTIEGALDNKAGVLLAVPELERIVKANVIDAFDHKHLNRDCPEFAALNPSVENITRVIWEKLIGRFGEAKLSCVRVYETPKTWSEYRGE